MQMLWWLIAGINLPHAPAAQYHCIYEVVEDGSHAGDSVPGWHSEVTLNLFMFEQGGGRVCYFISVWVQFSS